MRDEKAKAPPENRAQLGLDLTVRRPDYRRSNFVVTAANASALQLALAFLESNEPALAVTGPPGSGKSHLLHILAETDGGGGIVDAAALPGPGDDQGALILIDNAHVADPKTLLALLEYARARGRKIALAGAGAPRSWAHGLRDLETRMEAMARVSLDEPDEDLLRAVIVRRFGERQWRAAEGVAAYAAPRIPRTFAAAERFVAAVGAEAIAAGKPITLGLARKIVENLFEGASAS
jgi:chromosomal replication initiation ATPase DnaA